MVSGLVAERVPRVRGGGKPRVNKVHNLTNRELINSNLYGYRAREQGRSIVENKAESYRYALAAPRDYTICLLTREIRAHIWFKMV